MLALLLLEICVLANSTLARFVLRGDSLIFVQFGLVGRAYWRLHGPMEVNTAERAVQDNADSEPN